MRKIQVYPVLLSILIISSIWFHNLPIARAISSYSPGVVAGDTITYGIVSFNSTQVLQPFTNLTSFETRVDGVNLATNTVNATLLFNYNNGTQKTQSISGRTDNGLGNLFPYILAGGLAPGDRVYNTTQSYAYGYMINSTVSRSYAGAVRSVDAFGQTSSGNGNYASLIFYADQETGLLLEVSLTQSYSPSQSISLYFKATATNAWTPETTPDFTLDALIPTTINQGQTSSFQVTASSINDFTDTIGLTSSITSTNMTSPPQVTLGSSNLNLSSHALTATTTLVFETNSTTLLGVYTIILNATSSTVVHQDRFRVDVAPPDFAITANPGNLTITPGAAKNTTLTISSLGSFIGTISLFASPASSGINTIFTKQTITLNSTITSDTTTLEVNVAGNSLPGQTSIYIQAQYQNLVHTIYLPINVTGPDFSITANPTSITLKQGTSATSTISLTSLQGFSGPVILTTPFGFQSLTPTLTNSTLNLTPGGTANTTLTVFASPIAPPGYYYGIVVATAANGQSHNIYLNIQVTGPDFTFTTPTYDMNIKAGQSATATLTLSSVENFNGTIQLSTSTFGNFQATLSQQLVALNANASATVTLTVAVPAGAIAGYGNIQIAATSGILTHSVYIQVQIIAPDFTISANPFYVTVPEGKSGQTTVAVTSLNNFSGNITLTTQSQFQTSLTATSLQIGPNATATSTLTIQVQTGTLPGYYDVSVFATNGSLTKSVDIQIIITGPDFSISASPSFFSISEGGTANSTITLSSLNNFSGPVTITPNFLGGQLTTLPLRTMVTLSANSTLQTTFEIFANGSNPGTYEVQMLATAGSLSHSFYIIVQIVGPDFSIFANPASLNLSPGSSATTTITLSSLDGFSGNVTLSIPLSYGLTGSLANNTISLGPGGTGSTILTVTALTGDGAGYYSIIVNATSGRLSHTLYVQVQIIAPDFSLQTNPFSLTIKAGHSATETLTFTSLNGFNGTISLEFSTYGLTVTPTNVNVTLAPSGTATVSITIQAPMSTLPGSYYVSVNARGGFITHYTQVYVQVIGPDFTIQSNPSFLIIQAGGSAQSEITVTSLNGFNGNISLTLPAFTIPGLNFTLSPSTINLADGATSTTILIVTATLAAAGENMTIFISATGGNVTHYTQVYVSVIGPTFRLSTDHNFLVVPAGGSGTATITTTSVDGFSGNVTLSAVSFNGSQVSITPANITLSPGGSVDSTLTLTVPAGAASNTWYYNLVVTGTSGGLSRTIYMTVQVIAPSFSLTVSPIFLRMAAGTSGHSTIALLGLNGFSGTINLTSSSSPMGLTTDLSPSMVTLNSTTPTSTALLTITIPVDTTPGLYNVNINATTNSLFENITVLVEVLGPDFSLSANPSALQIGQGGSGTSTIAISGLNGFNGSVHLFGAVSAGPGVTTSFSPENVTLTPSNSNATSTLTINVAPGTYAGPYVITIIGSLVTNSNVTFLVHYATVEVTVPVTSNFQMLVNTGLLSIEQGSSGELLLTLTSLNGFSGNVTIIAQISAIGITVSPSQTREIIAANSTVQTNLTISVGIDTFPSTYSLLLNATSSGITHLNGVQIAVLPRPDFTLTASPALQTLHPGDSGSVVVFLLGQSGFSDIVQLFTTASPSGVSAVPDPATVQVLSSNVTEAVVMISTTAATSPGNYTISITANSTSGAHTMSVTVIVTPRPDFTLSTSASALIIQNGSSATSNLTVTPTAGFTGSVTLSATAPPGFTADFSINPITGGTGTSTLTITVGGSVTAGSYSLIVNGEDGAVNHTATISVTVTPAAKITLVVKQVSWTHRLSLSKYGSTQTFALTIRNTGMSPAYIQLLAAGNSTNFKSSFSIESPVTMLSAGTWITISLSQPFNSTSTGLKFNFTIQLLYGTSIDATGDIINPKTVQAVKGTFTIAS